MSDSGCWEWTGYRGARGYGKMSYLGQKSLYVHRMSYFAFTGTNPGKLDVCHTCDNPPCCNPLHLFLGTARDNAIDMVIKKRSYVAFEKEKTHCIRGHLLQGENLYINKKSLRRQCRECLRISYRKKMKDPEFKEKERIRLFNLRERKRNDRDTASKR